jgi:hypothetical protein
MPTAPEEPHGLCLTELLVAGCCAALELYHLVETHQLHMLDSVSVENGIPLAKIRGVGSLRHLKFAEG